MIGFSLTSLIFTLIIFYGVQFLVYSVLPPTANPFAASILAISLAVIVINFINAYRIFRRSREGILRNPAFHKFFLTNTFINLALAITLGVIIF